MVRFIGKQHNFFVFEIFIGNSVFFFGCQIGMQFLNGGKANIDVIIIHTFKVDNLCYVDPLSSEKDNFFEKKLCR